MKSKSSILEFLVFIIPTLIFTYLGYLLTFDSENSLYFGTTVVQVSIAMIYIFLISYKLFHFSEDYDRDFVQTEVFKFLLGLLLFLPVMISVLFPEWKYHYFTFWFSLIEIIVLSILLSDFIMREEEGKSDYLFWLSAAWIITSVYFIAGVNVLDFAVEPFNSITEVSNIMDMRYLLSSIFFLIVIMKAVISAFGRENPIVKNIRIVQIPISTKMPKIISPFIKISNLILLVILHVINLVRKFAIVTVKYLQRIAQKTVEIIFDVYLSKKNWGVLFIVAVLTITIFLSHIAKITSQDILAYIQTTNFGESAKTFVPLLVDFILIFIIGIVGTVASLNFYIMKVNNAPYQSIKNILSDKMQAIVFFLITLFLAGWILRGLSSGLDQFENSLYFKSFGLYTSILTIITFTLAIIISIRSFFKRKPDGKFPPLIINNPSKIITDETID